MLRDFSFFFLSVFVIAAVYVNKDYYYYFFSLCVNINWILCDISAGARLSASQKEMPRSRSSEFSEELISEDRYIQVTWRQILKTINLSLNYYFYLHAILQLYSLELQKN